MKLSATASDASRSPSRPRFLAAARSVWRSLSALRPATPQRRPSEARCSSSTTYTPVTPVAPKSTMSSSRGEDMSPPMSTPRSSARADTRRVALYASHAFAVQHARTTARTTGSPCAVYRPSFRNTHEGGLQTDLGGPRIRQTKPGNFQSSVQSVVLVE
ncbi:hypothetical protein V5799_030161 [Amblyomma americanum]|uniref:Uncharacterized protein n=1 Tax=Amblyomma americanum TaxID=6943 RepID=A0AAQ4ENY8_AMBAM